MAEYAEYELEKEIYSSQQIVKDESYKKRALEINSKEDELKSLQRLY